MSVDGSVLRSSLCWLALRWARPHPSLRPAASAHWWRSPCWTFSSWAGQGYWRSPGRGRGCEAGTGTLWQRGFVGGGPPAGRVRFVVQFAQAGRGLALRRGWLKTPERVARPAASLCAPRVLGSFLRRRALAAVGGRGFGPSFGLVLRNRSRGEALGRVAGSEPSLAACLGPLRTAWAGAGCEHVLYWPGSWSARDGAHDRRGRWMLKGVARCRCCKGRLSKDQHQSTAAAEGPTVAPGGTTQGSELRGLGRWRAGRAPGGAPRRLGPGRVVRQVSQATGTATTAVQPRR